MHLHSKILNKLEIKRNIFANTKRVDHAGTMQSARAYTPTRVYVSKPFHLAGRLPPLQEVMATERAYYALKAPVRVTNALKMY